MRQFLVNRSLQAQAALTIALCGSLAALAAIGAAFWITGERATQSAVMLSAFAIVAAVCGALSYARRVAARLRELETSIHAVHAGMAQRTTLLNGYSTTTAFSATLRQMVDTLQTQKAELAAANSVLETSVRERTADISTLVNLSERLAVRQDLSSLMSNMLIQVQSAVDYHTASIWLRERDNVVLSSYQTRDPFGAEHLEGSTLPDSYARMYRLMESKREPLVVNQSRRNFFAVLLAQVTEGRAGRLFQRARSWMMTPLVTRGNMIGALRIDCSEPAFFTPERERILTAISHQAALAIEHAKLAAQAEEAAIIAERNRIARELHDAVSQNLFAAGIIADSLSKNQAVTDPDIKNDLRRIQLLNGGALAEMRILLFELRPDALKVASVAELFSHLIDASDGRGGAHVRLSLDRTMSIPDPAKTAIYRIAQEALNNALRHSHATEVEVALIEVDDSIELTVRDNGAGFDTAHDRPGHFGLKSMRQRAKSIDAQISFISEPARGSIVAVVWPGETSTGGTV